MNVWWNWAYLKIADFLFCIEKQDSSETDENAYPFDFISSFIVYI